MTNETTCNEKAKRRDKPEENWRKSLPTVLQQRIKIQKCIDLRPLNNKTKNPIKHCQWGQCLLHGHGDPSSVLRTRVKLAEWLKPVNPVAGWTVSSWVFAAHNLAETLSFRVRVCLKK